MFYTTRVDKNWLLNLSLFSLSALVFAFAVSLYLKTDGNQTGRPVVYAGSGTDTKEVAPGVSDGYQYYLPGISDLSIFHHSNH